MQVNIKRTGPVKFEAVGNANPDAPPVVIDGPADMGGAGAGMRPMESVLVALATCSAMDIVHILKKQRQELKDLDIRVDGERREQIPKIYTKIHMHFTATGDVDPAKLARAVELSVDSYCSVASMIRDTVPITYTIEVRAEG